jgi:hypothetical protein
VRYIWRAHGLQPHRYRQFKLSNDPKFAEKLQHVVGLYVDPPAHAIALSVDEKSQIQALDRTQPGLPLKKGRLGTMTHDYKHHGTTTLFAALNVLDGTVIGRKEFRPCTEAELRSILSIQAYSQKQLSDVSVRLEELLRFITTPIQDQLEANQRQTRQAGDNIRALYANKLRKRGIEREIKKGRLTVSSLLSRSRPSDRAYRVYHRKTAR